MWRSILLTLILFYNTRFPNITVGTKEWFTIADFLFDSDRSWFPNLNRLAAHLELIGFDVSLVITEWFLCLFAKSLPSEVKNKKNNFMHCIVSVQISTYSFVHCI